MKPGALVRCASLTLVCTATTALAVGETLAPWVGSWSGPCVNLSPGTATPFAFEATYDIAPIAGTARFQWRSTFRAPGRDPMTKDYELVVVDEAKGHFRTDEGGGVLIDAYRAQNALYSHFEVENVQISSIERVEGDTLVIELLTFRSKPTEGSSPVKSFPFLTNQRCDLRRQPVPAR